MIQENLSDHPFWRFSTRLFEQQSLVQGLVALENEFGLNPNILLFCCWFANTGSGRLSKHDLQNLELTSSKWHECIVAQLTKIAAKLKNAKNSRLKYYLQPVESELKLATHAEQLLLTEVEIKTSKHLRNSNLRLQDACKNVDLYCKIQTHSINQTLYATLYPLIAISFPTVDLLETQKVCRSILQADAQLTSFAQPQLVLN